MDLPDGVHRNDPEKYAGTLASLREIPECVGLHLRGAYLRNHTRKRGLRGPDEAPDEAAIAGIKAANLETAAWVRRVAR